MFVTPTLCDRSIDTAFRHREVSVSYPAFWVLRFSRRHKLSSSLPPLLPHEPRRLPDSRPVGPGALAGRCWRIAFRFSRSVIGAHAWHTVPVHSLSDKRGNVNPSGSPTVRRRRLAAELRRLRGRKTGTEVARGI